MIIDAPQDDAGERTETLTEVEARYNQLIGAVSDYVCSVYVRDGRVIGTRHGENCVAITGYTPGEFAADPMLWIRLVVPEDRPVVTDQVEQILSGAGSPSVEHRLLRKDGAIRWVLNTPIPFKDAEGGLVRYDAVIRDVTDETPFAQRDDRRAPDVERVAELLRDDLLQLLTAARLRMEVLASHVGATPDFAQALHGVMQLLEQCARKARTISQKLTVDSPAQYEPEEGLSP